MLRPATTIRSFDPAIEARRQTALRRLRSYHGPPIRWVRGVRDLAKPRAREAAAPRAFGLPFLVDGAAPTAASARALDSRAFASTVRVESRASRAPRRREVPRAPRNARFPRVKVPVAES